MLALVPAVVALLADTDAVAAGWLTARLAAAEAAYAHVEADYRLTADERTADLRYVGSRGRGYRLDTAYTARPERVFVTLSNATYRADAGQMPGSGWVMFRVRAADPGRFPEPHAPTGLPDDPLSYRDHVTRRTGRLRVVAGSRDDRPVWTATCPVGPARGRPSLLTLELTADPPVVVLAARVGPPGRFEVTCDLAYRPDDDWPAVHTVRYRTDEEHGSVDRLAEFSRYQRLAVSPPADRFTLSALGLPEMAPPPPEPVAEPDPIAEVADPPADRRPWWAVAGIVAVGAVVFVRVGRR